MEEEYTHSAWSTSLGKQTYDTADGERANYATYNLFSPRSVFLDWKFFCQVRSGRGMTEICNKGTEGLKPEKSNPLFSATLKSSG